MTLLLSRTDAWTQLTGRVSAGAGALAAVVSKSSDPCPQLAVTRRTEGIEEYLWLFYTRNKSHAELE